MIMVRKSRYTYQLIEKSNEFTVTLPEDNDLKRTDLLAVILVGILISLRYVV